MGLEFECIPIEKDEGTSAILGHAGFIKTVEDLYEAMLCSVPGVKFGIAFAEASGPCLVRSEGNDEGLRTQAERSILKIAAGHTFLILFTGAYPINVITNVRNVSEVAVCSRPAKQGEALVTHHFWMVGPVWLLIRNPYLSFCANTFQPRTRRASSTHFEWFR